MYFFRIQFDVNILIVVKGFPKPLRFSIGISNTFEFIAYPNSLTSTKIILLPQNYNYKI